MMKKIIATVLSVTMLLSIAPLTSIYAVDTTEASREALEDVMAETRPLLYEEHTEQTAKYLYDRYQRAEAAVYNRYATEEEITNVTNELRNAISLLAEMKGSERNPLLSFDGITEADLGNMKESVGSLVIDKENKPESAAQSIVITAEGKKAVYSNGDGKDGIIGTSPFGVDMQFTDGLRLWIKVDAAATLSVTIGRRSAETTYYFTADEIPVEGEGYITIPYYYFYSENEAEMELTGVMNYIRIEANGADTLAIADLHAYAEIIEEIAESTYTEEKITSRGDIEDNAFYKIIEESSYEKGTPMAVSLVEDMTNLKIALEENKQGDRAQLWQLSPDPSDNGTYRIINKSTGDFLCINEADQLVYQQVDYNNPGQEFSITITRGLASIQVRNRGKLTAAGNSVKATVSNTFKKFVLLKVSENAYTESWADEFDAPQINRDIWNVDFAYFFGGGNGCLYIDSDELNYQKDGEIYMKSSMKDYNGYQASGSQLKSNGKFAMSYGKIEFRGKFDSGVGMWPSLWLMPVDSMNMARSEIDILEIPVRPAEYVTAGDKLFSEHYGTLHWTSDDGKIQEAKAVHFQNKNNVPWGDEYHTWGAEIDKDQIRMYVDGMLYHTLNFDKDGMWYAFADIPRYIIISPGGMQGDGSCVADPNLEYNDITMRLDYIRTWVPTNEATDTTPDFTIDESSLEPSSVQYLAKNYNDYMNSMPIAISPDGKEGVLADQSGFLAIFDPTTNKLIKSVSTGAYNGFLSVAYSDDGSKLAVGTMQGSVLIYDTSDYTKTPIKIHNGATIHYDVLFTNDGKYLITGGFNGGAQAVQNPIDGSTTKHHYFRVFDANTGTLVKEIYLGSDPLSFDLSPNGELLAVTTTSKGIFLYNTSDWSEYASFTTNHSYTISHCEFTSDGKYLGSSDIYGNVNIWDVEGKKLSSSLETVSESSVRKFAFSPDGKYIVTTSNDTAARLYEVASGRCISLLGGFSALVREVEFSPDGKYIVAASLDHTMKLFTSDGTYIKTLLQKDELISEGHIVSNLAFTPDSKYVFCVDASKADAINRWELPEGVDKTALKAAIEGYGTADEKLEEAKKVYSLKYATAKMVYEATLALTDGEREPSFRMVTISADDYSYADKINVNLNGWVYIKAEVSDMVDSVEMLITDSVDYSTKRIPVTNELKLGEGESTDGYTEWIIRTYFENIGKYSIQFVDSVSGSKSEEVMAKVAPVYTTRDFGYVVTEEETVTINSVITTTPDIYIPDYIDGYPVTEIAPYTFNAYGKTISNMTLRLPSTLKAIREYAFYECASLKKLVLPEGLETIEKYAFSRCLSLEEIEIPNSVTTIQSDAFYYTRGTNYIKVGNGLSAFEYGIFFRTYGNRTYIFEEGIEKVETRLNYAAPLLERIYLPESITAFSSLVFGDMRNIVTVYGIPGSYAETFAAKNPSKYTFVALADPVISGIDDKAEYDLYTVEGEIAATWDHGHIAYLNGERYVAGTPITEAGEYTLKVINGYDEYTTEITFTVVDTTPPPYKLGEMDGDGEITVADALAILRIVAKLAEPVGNQALAADCDLDGEITVADALAVLRYVAKLTDSL